MTWKTFQGKTASFNTIDHQHLSNCYWFAKIIFGYEETDLHLIEISNKLEERFNGQLLPYRPHVNFKMEIDELNKKGFLRYDNNNSNRIIIHNGNYEIGEILLTFDKKIELCG